MKTKEEILAECAGFTVDQINDSEPVIIVQHEALKAMSDFAAQSVREDRESRWISAKQKPETHELVNVLMTNGAITVGRFLNTNKWGIYTSTGIDIESQTNRVELWQTLPSPPTNKG